MEGSASIGSYRFNLRTFIVVVAVTWTVIVAGSWAWNVRQVRQGILQQAGIEARVAYEKDIVYRRWNTMHGGVYVRVTDATRPNPYLKGAERDVRTESGLDLTLINPAYMTRQANELATSRFGLQGHITSLNPLRPENRADDWEGAALKAFEEGAEEVTSIDIIMGREFMRLMRPLVTEEGCLRCHAEQGYQPGDIRGGISVALPLEPFRVIERQSVLTLSLAHGLFWVLGLAGHFFGTRKLVRSEGERRQAEEATHRYAQQLEESNHLKDLFIDIMRHDLLNPTSVIKCYAGYLLEEETDPRKRDLAAKIDMVNNKLAEMIENASKYSRFEEMDNIECSLRDLNAILRDSVLMATCQAEEEEGLVVEIQSEGEYPAWVNPVIGDVFVNLASNAVKYASEGKRVECGILDDGDSWRVYVRDFGPGISEGDKERIFTRFERLDKESVKGTGLGLAIAQRVVDLHNGRIWVEDNPEGGCIFFVALPKEKPPGTA